MFQGLIGHSWLTYNSSCTSLIGLKTLVFVFDSREGPKLTLNFKVGWQKADRLREGRHASSRQTGREKANRQKDANREQ
jgi:hypothetical protein